MVKHKPVRTTMKVQALLPRRRRKGTELEVMLFHPGGARSTEEVHVDKLMAEMGELEKEYCENYGYSLAYNQKGREWEKLKQEKAREYKRKKNQLRQRFSELNKKHKEVLNRKL